MPVARPLPGAAGALVRAVMAVAECLRNATPARARRAGAPCPGSMQLAAKCGRGYHLAVFRSPDRVADDMIEVVPSTWDGHGARLRLRPPRAPVHPVVRRAVGRDVDRRHAGLVGRQRLRAGFRIAPFGHPRPGAARAVARRRTGRGDPHRSRGGGGDYLPVRCSGRIPTGCGCASSGEANGFRWLPAAGRSRWAISWVRPNAGSWRTRCRIYWRPRAAATDDALGSRQ